MTHGTAPAEHCIELNLGATGHAVTRQEAATLRASLADMQTLQGQMLAAAIRIELSAEQPRRIRLGLDDIGALRGVLADERPAGASQGLTRLHAALRAQPAER